MFVRVCKEDTLMEGGMRVVIADAQLIVSLGRKTAS
jgi:toluene monooxygenase system ferredoxin subunit